MPSQSRLVRPWCLLLLCLLPLAAHARPKHPRPAATLYVSLIDQLPPQGSGPALNGLDERRRGPAFNAALQQVAGEGKLPPVAVLNRDLSLPATVRDEPKPPAGARLVRIYLTRWAQTPLGGVADTEIVCRFFVETRREGQPVRKLGPFFARRTYSTTADPDAGERQAQYQAVARQAVEAMAAALK